MINYLCLDICYTARKIYNYLNKNLEKYDITPEQLLVIKTLSNYHHISQKELSDLLDKDQNTIKAIVDKLQQKKFIERKQNPNDKRAYILELTENSKKILTELLKIEEQIMEKLTLNISDNDKTTVSSTLKTIRNNI